MLQSLIHFQGSQNIRFLVHPPFSSLLQVVRENRPGMLPETKGHLYVGGLNEPFAFLTKMKREVRELNNRIVECTYDTQAQKWVFMRERTDKSYPNGYKTAQGESWHLLGLPNTGWPIRKDPDLVTRVST